MSDQIRTAAELDALPVGSVVRCDDAEGIGLNVCERHREGWQYVGSALHFSSAQVASDELEFTVLYRPDDPDRTAPTEEQVAEAAHRGFCERRDGDLPNTFEKYDELDAERMAWWRSAAHAVLALFPQRVAPSEEESDHA